MNERRPRAWLAGLLAFLATGLGHYYAGNLRRAVGVLAFVVGARVVVAAVFTSSGGLLAINLATAAVVVVVGLGIVLDAMRCARRGDHPPARPMRRWSRYLLYAILAIAVVEIERDAIRERWFAAFRMPSVGMAPTMLPGDFFVVDKQAFRAREPSIGEVVAIEPPGAGSMRVQRIVGVAGDVVTSTDPAGSVLVNGVAVPGAESDAFPQVVVGPGEYFVLGDNGRFSTDSRRLGPIPREDIIGRISFIHFSLDPESRSPRWDRIGAAGLHWPQ